MNGALPDLEPIGLAVVASCWPVVAVALPLLGVVVALVRPAARSRAALLTVVAVSTVAVSVGLVAAVMHGRMPETYVLHMTPQLWLVLRVDAAGALYGTTVAGLGFLALMFSFGYLHEDPHQPRYYAFLMACLAATLGVAYAGNLLTFLLFYEAFSVLTYALVVHEQTPAAIAAGTKYIAYVLVGGSLVLAGVLLTFSLMGDVAFVAGGMPGAGASDAALRVAFWCFVGGFGVKAALVPLHGWVPDAHPAAPAPFSALLSGVMVAAGAFGIMRVVFDVFGVARVGTLGVAPWLAAIAAMTVLVGAFMAIGQPDLKRRLAYSTISQMGTVTLAVALLSPLAAVGALVHVVHHAFLKGTLFFCAGVWRHAHGARRVNDLRGLGPREPLVGAAFAVATLGMIGVPPLSGFVSKWWLGEGMLDAGAGWALAVLLLGTLLAAAYLLPVLHALYFASGTDDVAAAETAIVPADGARAPAAGRGALLGPTLVTAALALVFGLAATVRGFPLDLASRATAAWFGGG